MREFLRKVRIALTPRGMRLRCVLGDGVIVEGRNAAGWGGRGIYLWRDDIEPEFKHFTSLIDPGAVVVDIGANTGIYSLRAAARVGPTGVVVAVEPFPELAADLHRNVMLNRFVNVRTRCLCAGGATEATQLFANFAKPNSFSLLRRDPAAVSISALKITLDDLFVLEKLDRLDYVKIDAEGAEQEILDGGRRVLAKHRPIIQAEVSIASVQRVNLDSYIALRAHRAGGKLSHNRVFIPAENRKLAVAEQLGWRRE
jgi:FkbM family methyltransferase